MMLPKPPGLAPLLSLASLLLVFLVRPSLAVYQDEAFNIDFAHSLVGTPIRHNTFFHRPNTVSKATLLYTLGEKGVLGAINPRDGDTVWRTLVNDTVPSSEAFGDGILRAHESSTTVVTAFDRTVRAWDAKDGRLVWEVPVEHKVKSLELLGPVAGQVDVVVLTEGEADTAGSVFRLAGGDGTVQWEQAGAAAASDLPLGLSVAGLKLFVTSLSPAGKSGYKVKVRSVDASTGKESSQYTLNTDSEISSEASILHLSGSATAPLLAWTDKKSKVHVNILGSKQTTTAVLGQENLNGGLTGISLVEPPGGSSPSFLLQYDRAKDHLAEVYRIDMSAGRAEKAFELPKLDGYGSFSASVIENDVFFIRYTRPETLLYSSKDSTVLERWPGRPVDVSTRSISVLHSASELAPKGDGHYSVRTAVVTNEGDWEMSQNGAPAWVRYEGLSGIVAAAIVDLPPEGSLIEALNAAESHSNIVSAYIDRVQRHLKDLRYLPAWLQTLPARLVSSVIGVDIAESSHALDADTFGFKKIIVVATAKGRIAALGTADRGQILWSKQVTNRSGRGKDAWDVRRIDVHGTLVYVMATNGEYVIIGSTHGYIHKQSPGTQGVQYYVHVPTPEGDPNLLAISADGSPGLLPDGVPSSSYIVTQATDGSVTGWKPTANGKTAIVWSFSPKSGETVTSVSTRPAHDPVASIGRARGDRNVLYKFLSPNLALVTASSIVLSTVSVYLLDTVTGQVLYSATHDGVDATLVTPVTMSENWFAYSIFSDVSRDASSKLGPTAPPIKGHQLIISELFESPIPNDRGPLGTAQNYSSLTDGYRPYVESSAVVIPAPVTVLSTTSTLQGITPRSLLAYSPALAAIVSLPIPFLSPLRPVGREPDASEREEGLMRYQANLDFAPTWYLSHQRELLGINKIISTVTKMESSSLVFAFGDLDVFATRVAPIGTFDILGEGFGKGQLVLTVLGLAVGTSFLAPMARRKAIDGLWKT